MRPSCTCQTRPEATLTVSYGLLTNVRTSSGDAINRRSFELCAIDLVTRGRVLHSLRGLEVRAAGRGMTRRPAARSATSGDEFDRPPPDRRPTNHRRGAALLPGQDDPPGVRHDTSTGACALIMA